MDQERSSAENHIPDSAKPESSRTPVISLPFVITFLLVVMAGIFGAQELLPNRLAWSLEHEYAFVPARITSAIEIEQTTWRTWVPFVSHAFLHANPSHILFNGLWLMVFGSGVANRMGADWGTLPIRLYRTALFLLFFVVCAVAGAGLYYVAQPSSPIMMVGASGAISGLMAAGFRVILPNPQGIPRSQALAPILSKPVLAISSLIVVLNLATAFGAGQLEVGGRIAWEAHLGGYFAGLFLFPLFDRAVRRR